MPNDPFHITEQEHRTAVESLVQSKENELAEADSLLQILHERLVGVSAEIATRWWATDNTLTTLDYTDQETQREILKAQIEDALGRRKQLDKEFKVYGNYLNSLKSPTTS